MEKPKGLYPKLLVIQQKINGLAKDKASNNYKYVTGSKVLENIKPLMNSLGLILKQEVLSIENTRQDYRTGVGTQYEKPKSEILSKVMMRFTWIDTETGEKDENSFGANGQNDWEKGLGSALTYAERYFLLKYFHIDTDEDDIDNSDRKPQYESAPAAPEKKPLVKMDGKDMTKTWLSLVQKITAKDVKDLVKVKEFYTLEPELEAELLNLIKSVNDGSK